MSDNRHVLAADMDKTQEQVIEPTITIAISNYNGRAVLEKTLDAIRALDERLGREVLVVDDGSVDDSVSWIHDNYPNVRIIRMEYNTKRLNAVRNRALRESKTRYVMLIDNDIVLNDQCVRKLQKVLKGQPDTMCCTPRLLYYGNPRRIYHDGSGVHYLALPGKLVRDQPIENHPVRAPEPTIGCGIMMIDRQRASHIDYFDDTCPIGCSDAEFHIRGRLYGYQVLHVSDATCLHIERAHGRDRAYAQIYNRYRWLLCFYSLKSLLVLAPMLILFELFLSVIGLAKGVFLSRLRAMGQIFRERKALLAKRRLVQGYRQIPDRNWLVAGHIVAAGSAANSWLIRTGARIMTPMFDNYWKLVRRWL